MSKAKAIWHSPRGDVCFETGEPGTATQTWHYASAVWKWKAAGSPSRSQPEIDRILAICQDCPEFIDDARPRCRLCGCSINAAPNGLVNKIAMATESCPAKPPKWEKEQSAKKG